MISRICICCGEAFCRKPNEAAENPNLCAACSQITDEETAEWDLDDAPSLAVPGVPGRTPIGAPPEPQEVTGC